MFRDKTPSIIDEYFFRGVLHNKMTSFLFQTLIYTNNQTICLEEEYFERATEFLPERWMRDGSATTRPPSRFVMLPFGYGPRMCIGRRFAEQEIYLALIKVSSWSRLRTNASRKDQIFSWIKCTCGEQWKSPVDAKYNEICVLMKSNRESNCIPRS